MWKWSETMPPSRPAASATLHLSDPTPTRAGNRLARLRRGQPYKGNLGQPDGRWYFSITFFPPSYIYNSICHCHCGEQHPRDHVIGNIYVITAGEYDNEASRETRDLTDNPAPPPPVAVIGGALFGFDISSMSAIIGTNQFKCYFNQGPAGPPFTAGRPAPA
ncbi:high affinity glucose transporter [Teratosphaeria destructans]|uniref:High affinity glucose transporter n=1 Tax=Teratosphaeria destructans TaxID=418781 RepID=A0A9W7W228_9PEZI|nr:high affinity glucose transporter [Teratosphaeria destructans]